MAGFTVVALPAGLVLSNGRSGLDGWSIVLLVATVVGPVVFALLISSQVQRCFIGKGGGAVNKSVAGDQIDSPILRRSSRRLLLQQRDHEAGRGSVRQRSGAATAVGSGRRRAAGAALSAGALLLVLTLALSGALSGCDYIGTAGVSTTMEEGPPTTERTPGTAEASTQERENLDQGMWDSFSALAAGIWLVNPYVDIDDLVNQSQLIVRGTVTKVDAPHAPVGSVANPYIVFYVDPAEILKGSPRFGTPLPLAIPGRGEDTPDHVRAPFEEPLEAGDDVLVFSYRGDEDLPTRSGARGANFLWNDTYGLFLPAASNYVCVRTPYTYATLDEVRRIVGPDKNTSTTLPAGYLSFEGKTVRFEDRLTARRLPGTLPYEVMTGFDVNWVADAIRPAIDLTAVKGYRLANGDRVFLFDTILAMGDFSQKERAVLEGLRTAAVEEFEVPGDHVWSSGMEASATS